MYWVQPVGMITEVSEEIASQYGFVLVDVSSATYDVSVLAHRLRRCRVEAET